MDILKIKNVGSDQWITVPTLTGPVGPIGPAGPTGANGVYIGSSEPTDSSINIWVDTEASGTSVVTSVNGQTGAVTILDMVYPVGSIYMSVNSTSPSILFGGTWEPLYNSFLLGAGNEYAVNSMGGTLKHTHSYGFQYNAYYYATPFENATNAGIISYDSANNEVIPSHVHTESDNITINSGALSAGKSVTGAYRYKQVGNVEYVDNLPPYIAVYMWKRTA